LFLQEAVAIVRVIEGSIPHHTIFPKDLSDILVQMTSHDFAYDNIRCYILDLHSNLDTLARMQAFFDCALIEDLEGNNEYKDSPTEIQSDRWIEMKVIQSGVLF
jgi:hypothetical protein